jgi:hypothetical protein
MKKLVVAGALALGLLAASPGSAAASVVWCSWDPLVAIVTPAGHVVLVYDSVWTSNLVDLAVPLGTASTKRAYGSSGRPVTAVDVAITVPTGLLFRYSTMDEVTTGLLGSGKLLARGFGTSGKTVHLKFTIPES